MRDHQEQQLILNHQAAKGAIRRGIIAAIKELQCDHTGAKFSEPVSTGDVGGRKLCEALEALLLHGTRHSFLGKIAATFSPSPSTPRYYIIAYKIDEYFGKLENAGYIFMNEVAYSKSSKHVRS